MKRHATTAALGLLVTCAIAIPVFAIVGGEADTDNEFPNVCSIVITTQPASQQTLKLPQTLSSGTLVHPKVVMTAGHSVEFMRSVIANNADVELSDFAVICTPSVYDGDAVEYGIAETHIHPDYTTVGDAGRNANSIDVGVLILTDAVTGITPVALPDQGFLGTLDLDRGPSDLKPEFLVVGYGTTDVPKTGALPPGERRVAVATFKSLRTRYLMMSQHFAHDEGGLSRGDSGGAAFWELDDGSLVQVGVTVSGDAASVSYGACVRTDLQTVIDFIQDAIDGLAE